MIEEIYREHKAEIALYEQENKEQVCEKCKKINDEIDKVLKD